MKNLLLALAFCLYSLAGQGQATYHGLPVLKAVSAKAGYHIGKSSAVGDWTIEPDMTADTLTVTCWAGPEAVTFFTDSDSLAFAIRPNESRSFYVLLNGAHYALTVAVGIKPAIMPLAFDTKSNGPHYPVWYEQNRENAYLQRLLAAYPLQRLTANAKTDADKALAIAHWVHQQWRKGSAAPRRSDAISILEEAQEGKLFGCVEYSTVAAACLHAVGLKARVLALKTKDAQTQEPGAGYVVVEVYLNDLGKWALLDSQWDTLPMRKGVPLNAVELQQAITRHYHEVEIASLSQVAKYRYVKWIYPFLYYFDVRLDNRVAVANGQHQVDGKAALILVPAGAKNPTTHLGDGLYTHSLRDFYAPPAP